MSKCYEHIGLLTCDKAKGHDGKHRDDWIMSVPVEFEPRREGSEANGEGEALLDVHQSMYGDARRVREARVQAKGRIAARNIRFALIDVWAEPLVEWLTGVAGRGVSAGIAQRWGRRH